MRPGPQGPSRRPTDETALVSETIEIGVVARPHGIQGALRIKLHNPTSDALLRADSVCIEAEGRSREHQVLQARVANNGAIILLLDGVSDATAAEALRGARVLVTRATVGSLGEGEYLYRDLVGCQVLDDHDAGLGSVVEVFCAGASDILVVRDGEGEVCIPFVDEWILDVDPARGIVRVHDGDQWRALKSRG